LLASDGGAQIALRDLVELAVNVEDKSMEMGVLLCSLDDGVLVLDVTVMGVLIILSDATVVRSILLLSLCLQIHLLHHESLFFALVE